MFRLACALLLCAAPWADAVAPGPSRCSPQEIPNMVIDATNAVARGARFTDPLKAAGPAECASMCCSKTNNAGDNTCNLAIYDTRRGNMLQNCYLFLCPKPESCPMTPSRGVLSYSFWTEKSDSDTTDEDLLLFPDDDSQVQDSSSRKESPAMQEAAPAEPEMEVKLSQHEPEKQKKNSASDVRSKSVTAENKAEAPDRITSKLLHLADNIDKQLEKMEAASMEDKDLVSVEISAPPTEEELLLEPTTGSRHKDLKKLLTDTKEAKSGQMLERRPPETQEVYHLIEKRPPETQEVHHLIEKRPPETQEVHHLIEKRPPETQEVHHLIEKRPPETLEVHFPTLELRTTLAPPIRTSPAVTIAAHRPAPKTRPTTFLASIAASKEGKVAKKVPSSGRKVGKVLPGHDGAMSSSTAVVVVNGRGGHLGVTTRLPTAIADSALPVTRFDPSQTPLLKTSIDGDHPVTSEADRWTPERRDSSAVEDAPRNLNVAPGEGEKSGLVAALVFGVVFLLLIIGVVSHKVSEARRRHQYTKLDYLINGMYVDT